MAFFPDLSPHTYTPDCGLEVVNVGWLDEGNEFPTGSTSPKFHAALLELCKRPIYEHRGVHECWFCLAMHRRLEGNGQIRVQGKNGVWYVAPTMVHHYVTCHSYLPPQEFIDAVLATVPDRVPCYSF
jgi:hypothetical protein